MGLLYFGLIFLIVLIVGKIVVGANIEAPPANLCDDDIINVAKEGKKIQAVKWYRTLHACSLKDAKEAVEKFIRES